MEGEPPAGLRPGVGEVREASRREVVHDVDAPALGEHAIHEGRPDETGPTRDECLRDDHPLPASMTGFRVVPPPAPGWTLPPEIRVA